MKASLRWLKTMVDVPNDLKSFTEQLDLTGTAVDSVDSVGKSLDGVYVGQIVSKEQVPSSDHLWITLVDVGGQNLSPGGQPEPLQIVCGAQNFNTGDKTAVALIGTTLPNGTQINKTKLRGVESFGMNCSAQELGLGDDHEGILVLPEDAPIGIPFAEYMQLNDVVLDLEITPNRPDCMSMLGVAREIAAVYDTSYNLPGISDLLEGQASIKTLDSSEDIDKLVSVSIDDADRCTRYTARLIKGVKVGPSPDWLVERINAAGARSINNIVDITNYIMFEVGQPLHAFDYDCLQKDAEGKVHIRVRAAREHEAFTSLDAVERVLDPDVSCIVDANAGGEDGKTIALAGVMGGLTSEVTEDTVNILLESASFSTTHTSRTSRRLKLVSESSTRFERGVDDATCNDFSDRAAQLMAVLAGGEIVPGVIDVYLKPRDIPQLVFRVGRFGKFVGQDIPADEVASILKRLGCL
ncbi:MAG: phenylalanine--tRNA ligase subunit beta, partial [Coriobacteriia bacterium]|nr:phenylalanine--tRNA ligase subunit beta [Coriobacteriia bacterium]